MSLTSMLLRVMSKRSDDKRDAGLTTPEGIERFDNLRYGGDPKWNLLDVYRPKGMAGKLPVIVSIHGGGWVYGDIPCFRCLTKEEIEAAYERNTGLLIVSEFGRLGKDPAAVPGCLCKNHGPFAWGKDPFEAVHNAVVLEEVAKMACRCETINPQVQPAPQELQDKHYLRKHGKNAYYGQN